eukprot:gene25898-34491_t
MSVALVTIILLISLEVSSFKTLKRIHQATSIFQTSSSSDSKKPHLIDNEYDVVVIGAGIGGLSAAAILSSVYKLRVVVFEKHNHPGGCAHSFQIKAPASPKLDVKSRATYTFDSGPTIILGCRNKPYNPLRQVFNFVGAGNEIDWIPWNSWGMCTEDGNWKFELGDQLKFEAILRRFSKDHNGNEDLAIQEFRQLREACVPLTLGAANIPTKALRGDKYKLLTLLPHLEALKKVIPYADVLDGSFKPFMDAHVKDPWLKSWLNALAFSLSGLEASQTGAAAMAYTLYDLHRDGASMDYPRGGIGKIADTLVSVIEQSGGRVCLSQPVQSISVNDNMRLLKQPKAEGVFLSSGQHVRAKRAVICNTDIWTLPRLLASHQSKLDSQQRQFFFQESSNKSYTKSFMHLHLGLDATGLDLSRMQAHFTVMDKGLHTADPCADRNMIAVSNPSVLDSSLVDSPNKMIVHAYSAGNEDYNEWAKFSNDRKSKDYREKKSRESEFLYTAVSRALDLPVGEIKERVEVALEGSPLTHERFLQRYKGTYGAAWGSMLKGPTTPLRGLYLAGDSVFPGIGVPAVALSGASAANSIVNVVRHIQEVLRSDN